MTEPTDLGEIVAWGQRSYTMTYPTRGGGGGGGGGGAGDGGDHQNEVGDQPYEPDPTPDPCSDPDKRREWNADAAAARARKEILRRAEELDGPDGFWLREWGVSLFEMPDGSVVEGAYTHGAQRSGTVDIDETAPPGGVKIGEVHSHPIYAPISQPDWDRMNIAAIEFGRAQRSYLLTRDFEITNNTGEIAIFVYDSRQPESAQTSPPAKVNPEGEPCPGV